MTDALKGTLTAPYPGGLSGIGFGTVTVNGTSPQTIALSAFNAGDIVLFGLLTAGGTVSPAGPAVLTVTTGTGFTVGATASDTSTYNYWVFRPTSQAT
jgi:hypothetical protein